MHVKSMNQEAISAKQTELVEVHLQCGRRQVGVSTLQLAVQRDATFVAVRGQQWSQMQNLLQVRARLQRTSIPVTRLLHYYSFHYLFL